MRYDMDEKYRPFLVTAIVGCIFWLVLGSFHAFALCIDHEAMKSHGIDPVVPSASIVVLVATGIAYGFFVELAKFIGAASGSKNKTVIFPFIAGTVIGAIQGSAVTSGMWGFPHNTIFKPEEFRVFTGGFIGFILMFPTILASIGVRQFGRQW